MTTRLSLIFAGLVLGAALAVSPAQAERLIVSVSNHRVTVTPNYSGEELVLFGSVEKDPNTPVNRNNYDLVVTVAGPRADMKARCGSGCPRILPPFVLPSCWRLSRDRIRRCGSTCAPTRAPT